MKNMKCKMKKVLKEWQWTLLALFTICIYSCKDDENVETETFDPSKPVVISDFTPKEGGAYQKLLIYGENFGTDASNVKVKIGGKEAIVLKSTFNVDETAGDGSLNPNSTYENFSWLLIRNQQGEWQEVDHGY